MRFHPWNIVFLIGFIAYVAIRGVFDKRTNGIEKSVRRMDGLERVLLSLVFLGSIVIPILYLFTPLLAFADYSRSPVLPWCGAFLMVAALWVFWRSHKDLGPNWSITLELRKDHQLVKGGVYRLIRHPMYAAIFLFDLAQGLLLANWLAGWAALLTFAVMYFVRMPREEQMMRECFGQEYRDYILRTGRVFPRLSRSQSLPGSSPERHGDC
jgi:protein-S-isoprenylcysteine O-methyltransferase Ste14